MTRAVARAEVDELVVAAAPDRWTAAGFVVDDDDVCRAGTVRLRLAGEDAGRGIVAMSVRGLAPPGAELPPLDGLAARPSSTPPAVPTEHQNGVERLDHLVALTPDLDRSVAALEDAGLDLRRVREGPTPGGASRQAFFRLGEVVLELIEQRAPDGGPVDRSKPARLWGLAFLAPDLDRAASVMGERLGAPRDALQPGRRIATASRSAGLGVAVALITPPPREPGGAKEAIE
jgi:hypothetical protein